VAVRIHRSRNKLVAFVIVLCVVVWKVEDIKLLR